MSVTMFIGGVVLAILLALAVGAAVNYFAGQPGLACSSFGITLFVLYSALLWADSVCANHGGGALPMILLISQLRRLW